MKKKTAAIGLLMSLLSLGEPVAVKAGSISTPVGFIFSIAESSKAESAYSLNKQGNTKLDTGDINGAISHYSEAIEIDQNYINAYINLGNIKDLQLRDRKGDCSDWIKAYNLGDEKSAKWVKEYCQ